MNATRPPRETRRQPQQQRSRAKVDAILDAADQLVLAEDTDVITTTLIADRAGVAVGTLYQYFDGVPAIVRALVDRHIARFGDSLEAAFADCSLTRKRDAANGALDALIAYYRTDPSFRRLWTTAPRETSAGFNDASESLVGIITDALVEQGLLELPDEIYRREADVQWATATALVELAFSRDPDGDPAILAHLRRLFDLDVRPLD